MKWVWARAHSWLSLPALLILIGTAHASDYLDLRKRTVVHGDPQAGAAKSPVCLGCHGPTGNPVVPMFPRLAGQRVSYLYWRLVAFKSDDPSSSPMPALVKDLKDEDLRNLAEYFAAQTPAADSSAAPSAQAPENIGKGRELYLQGDPARGLPPCLGCHGAHLNGPPARTNQYAVYPALRGQQSAYVAARLTAFRDRVPQRTTSDFVMHAVAKTLDDDSIQVLAAWIGSVPPGNPRP